MNYTVNSHCSEIHSFRCKESKMRYSSEISEFSGNYVEVQTIQFFFLLLTPFAVFLLSFCVNKFGIKHCFPLANFSYGSGFREP
jgi:hypothetical protein